MPKNENNPFNSFLSKQKRTLLSQFYNLKNYYLKHQDCLTVKKVKKIDKYLKKLEKELL